MDVGWSRAWTAGAGTTKTAFTVDSDHRVTSEIHRLAVTRIRVKLNDGFCYASGSKSRARTGDFDPDAAYRVSFKRSESRAMSPAAVAQLAEIRQLPGVNACLRAREK